MTNDINWKARNKKTGELCPHFHHSMDSAMRCAIAIYGDEVAGVRKWTRATKSLQDIAKNNKRRAVKVHNQMYSNALDKENNRKANKVKQNTGSRKHRSIRGVVRFNEED